MKRILCMRMMSSCNLEILDNVCQFIIFMFNIMDLMDKVFKNMWLINFVYHKVIVIRR